MNSSRALAIPFVIGIHVLAASIFLVQRMTLQIEPAPLTVSLIAVPHQSPPPPPPPPTTHVETVVLPVMITPQVTIADPPPVQHAVTVTDRVQVNSNVVTDATPVTEARFDADYLKNPPPSYPAASKRMHEQGLVMLKVKVRPDGSVDTLHVHRSSGSSRLDDAALATVRQWRFVPAQRGNETITAWVLVPVEFKLNQRGSRDDDMRLAIKG